MVHKYNMCGCYAFNMPTYKIIATCIQHATVLQSNNTCVTHGHKQVKACLAINVIGELMSGSFFAPGEVFKEALCLRKASQLNTMQGTVF